MANGFFGRFGETLSARDDEELWRRLSEIDASVVTREGIEMERYCVVHYLRTLARSGLLEYPFDINKRERPDCRVQTGERIYGLEVTEAGPEEHQAALTKLEKKHAKALEAGEKPPVLIGVKTVVQPKTVSAKETASGRETASDRRSARREKPFVRDEGKRRWTEDIVKCVDKKTEEKLDDYEVFDEDHLLIGDSTPYPIPWTVTELPGQLAAALKDRYPPAKRKFGRISVLRGRVLMYDVTGLGHLLPVPPSKSLAPLRPLTRLGVDEQSIADFCRQHHIRKLGFFGSIREDRFGPDSDVDVLVEFEPGQRMGLLRLAGIELELGQVLGRKADLRTAPDLSRYFREEVVREKTDLAYVHAAG